MLGIFLTLFLGLLSGLVVIAFIVYVDFCVVEWIFGGGLKTLRRRLFLVYLPVVLWAASGVVVYWRDLPGFKVFYVVFGAFYAIGFLLYGLMNDVKPEMDYLHLAVSAVMMIAVAVTLIQTIGLRFNLTPSMPKGIYLLEPAEEKPQRGDMVTFCLESDNPFTALARERDYIGIGTCPSGLKPLLKVLAGLPGDVVEVAPDGIMLNGAFLSGSARPDCDSHSRPVPPSLLMDGPIPPGMALLISQQHSGSFDSRHFGLVPYDSLQKVSPVFTGKEVDPHAISN